MGRTAADIYYRMEIDDKSAVAKLERMGRHLRNFGVAATAVGVVAGAALLSIVGKFAKVGDQLGKMSKRVNISVESLSELKFAAEQSGASLEGLDPAIKKMHYSIAEAADGVGTYVDALARVGLTAEQLEGLSTEEKFLTIGTAIGGLTDETQKAAAAQELFGRGGMTLIPLLEEGAEGIAKLREEARTTGNVMTKEQSEIAEAYTDAMNKVRHTMMGVVTQIATGLAPWLSKMAAKISDALPKMARWISENQGLIKVIGGVIAGMVILGPLMTGFGMVLMNLTRIIGAMRVAMALLSGPFGWAIIALTSIAALVVRLISSTKNLARENMKLAESYHAIELAKMKENLTAGQSERTAVAERIKRIQELTGNGRDLTSEERAEVSAHLDAIDEYGSRQSARSGVGRPGLDRGALARGDSRAIGLLKGQLALDAEREYRSMAAHAPTAEGIKKYTGIADQLRGTMSDSEVDMGLVTTGVAYKGSAAEASDEIASMRAASDASAALSDEAKAYNARLQDEIEVATLRGELEGEKLDLAMLERERAKKLAEVAAMPGASADLVNALYDLRAKQIGGGQSAAPVLSVPSAIAQLSQINVSSSSAMRGAGGFGSYEQQKKAAEEADAAVGGGGGGGRVGIRAGGFIANAKVAALQGISSKTSLEATSGRTAAATEKTAEAAKKIIDNTDPRNLRASAKPVPLTFGGSGVGARLGA